MTTAAADAELHRRSAFRVLLPALLFGLIVLVSTLIRIYIGDQAMSALVLRGGVGLIALWAVVDGLRRGFGRPTYLGTGRGLDRLFGFAQVVASIGVALALLPNTIDFLNFVARLATGGATSSPA
ncbi:MAG: hypothetical protein M3442_03130 [Chloroflexota bacterium]|nr:hypothetical protein [Chloroflexota bacterium]